MTCDLGAWGSKLVSYVIVSRTYVALRVGSSYVAACAKHEDNACEKRGTEVAGNDPVKMPPIELLEICDVK